MRLYEPKIFIALVLQDLGEESDIMIFLNVSLHSSDDRSSPLHNNRLQKVLLIQVGEHVLLERLFGELVIRALLVEYDF